MEKLISSHCFLNKYSKDFFDNGVGIHRRKEDLKKVVMYLLSYINESLNKCQRSL